MTTYCDSSVLLRLVLGQTDLVSDWRSLQPCVASRLVEVECHRTIDRVRLERAIDDETMVIVLATLRSLLRGVELIEISTQIMREAARPMSLAIGTLDAIHLVTALAWREHRGDDDMSFVTHDQVLARAARAQGFAVFGA
jgi:predicted nucleic acid-binding protein